MSSRSPQVARNSSLVAAGMYLIIGSLPLMIGLIGPQLAPGLEDPEQLLPTIARQHLHTFLYVLFAGALVSAMLSTVDSALLAVGSLASHNVISPLTKITSEMGKVRLARMCVAIAGGIAFFVAISSDSILSLVEFASSLGGSGVLVIALFGLFTRFGGQWAALAALVGGVVMLFVGEHLFQFDAPFLASVAAALAAFVVIGLIFKK
jgi:Na+/proline symporter